MSQSQHSHSQAAFPLHKLAQLVKANVISSYSAFPGERYSIRDVLHLHLASHKSSATPLNILITNHLHTHVTQYATSETMGKELELHGLPVYTTGDGETVIVIITDPFGWNHPDARFLADTLARSTSATVWMPDFFSGTYSTSPLQPREARPCCNSPLTPPQAIPSRQSNSPS